MFDRCLYCHRDLPANEALEHFPVGRRVAYDPGRGRLWAVCPACRRWNLAPIEERWEALEELEKAVKDRSRLLSQTDNIALLRSGELDIVRVGRANLTEEAWWRYGMELVKRRRTYQLLTVAGVGGVLALMAGGLAGGAGVFGSWWMLGRLGKQAPKIGRALKFGRQAWRGRALCPRCGSALTSIPFRTRGALVAGADAAGGVAVGLRCLECEFGAGGRPTLHSVQARVIAAGPLFQDIMTPSNRWRGRYRPLRLQAQDSGRTPLPGKDAPGYLITGVEAELLLRRVLAYQNFAGAREEQVRRATSLIESAGSAPSLAQTLTGNGRRLSGIDATQAIALEIAVNEDRERRLLELELAALEQRWQEEEEIAAIMDGELTWIGSSAPAADARQPPPGDAGAGPRVDPI